MMRVVLSLAVLSTALLPSSLWAQAQGDTIYLYKGTPVRGTITKMSPDEVTVSATAGERPIPVGEIKYIVYQDEPNELSAGRKSIFEKNFNQAINELKKADPAKAGREVIAQDIEFYRAVALVRSAMGEGGDKAAAESAILNAVKVCGQNYHFYEAAEVAGDLAMASGKFADASKRYSVIITRAAKHPEMVVRARLADGRSLAAQKKYDEAKARYDEVLGDELNTPSVASLKLLANVGKAGCLTETGQAAEAIKALETIIEKNDPSDAPLFARTYVALGNAYVKADKPKDAIMAFLCVELLYAGESEALAESLYNLAKLWDKVNRADRALSARNTLRDRFPGSIWTQTN